MTVAYAQEGQSIYEFKWETDKGLDPSLGTKDYVEGSKEALVSWKVGTETSKYVLEYMVEEEQGPEKVRFTFNREIDNKAKVKLEVLGFGIAGEEKKIKDYNVFDFTSINTGENWIEHKAKTEVDLDITGGTRYQGGRVRVGNMDIRYRWKDGSVHFQTSYIKDGNITPFSLQYANGAKETIKILTGVEGYTVSPMHVDVKDNIITNKEVILTPGTGEKPGFKPGIKIDFKRPKQWNEQTKKFQTLDQAVDQAVAQNMVGTLELADLTDTATARLLFNLDEDSKVTGLDKDKNNNLINQNKKIKYDDITKTYSLYLTKEDIAHEHIIKWETLDESMILKRVQLSLIQKDGVDGEKAHALGSFTPQPPSKGRYTYLGYTIKRSSMEEAFLQVQPYNGARNTEYTYVVQVAANIVDGAAKWVDLVEHKYMTTGQNAEKPFTIPVPFSSNFDDQYYRVIAKYNQVIMNSQVLHYQPNKDLTVPPPTPVIQMIDNIYVVPPLKQGGKPEAIGFDLTWSAPKNTSQNKALNKLLEQGNIYYELFFHEDLKSTEGKGTLTKVFKVSLDEENQISVQPHAGTAGKEPVGIRYNPSKDTFTIENIVLKNLGQTGWEQIEIIDPTDDEAYEEGSIYPEFDVTNNMKSQDIPGVYYITMKALYEKIDADVPMGSSNLSNPKSITLSPLDEVIPVPTKIESKHEPDENDLSIISQSISWDNIDLDRYIKQMLDPLNVVVGQDGQGIYEVYLYQDKNIDKLNFTKEIPRVTDLDRTKSYKLDDNDLEDLRKGGVIRLDYKGSSNIGKNNVTLDRLDANQVYYTTIRVRLDVKNKQDGKDVEKRYSVFSKEHTFTAITNPNEPGPGERVPPVPEALQIIAQPNNTTAKIGWKAPDYNKQEDEIMYYQMLRLDSRQLAIEENSRLLSIKKLINIDGKNEMQAWRTKEALVDQYTKNTDTWAKVVPEQASNKLQLEDIGLSPNRIYYYYVRTVLLVEGEEVYSSWVGIPVTTDPIQKPVKLKVEDTESYPHDPKREIVVSFLAPIPKNAKIPEEYDFDIAVQGELDESYKLDYAVTRVASKEDEKNIQTGYTHLVYKITNVKPGKRYDIKVRVIDKVIGVVNGEHPKSLYADRVTTRTHFDQDEQDQDDKFKEYLKYFEDKAEALRRKPYWILDENKKGFSAKYRSNYIVPEINSTKTYKLAIQEGITDFTYYMPASVMASTNLNQTSFEIKQDHVTYSIRPSTITTELKELKEALEDISAKRIRDYYVSFRFRQVPTLSRSGIDPFLTPQIIVDIELVRLKEEDLFLEDDILIALNKEISSEKSRFISDIERALERGKITKEALDSIVEQSITGIEKNHQKDVKSILKQNTSKVVSIDNWNKSMLIMATIDGNAMAQGYRVERQEIPLTTFNVGAGYGIEANQSGIYIFKGQKVNIPVIPGAGGASNLVVKYQLTDFFGTNGGISPNDIVIKRDVLGAMARVLGAPRGADYIQYLKQMDIKGVNNVGTNLPLKKGEGIYLLMQVYEKTHQKLINSVYIKNRNAISNIREFNQLHQQYVLVAVDSKIIDIGSGINPNDFIQVKDILQILTNVMAEMR